MTSVSAQAKSIAAKPAQRRLKRVAPVDILVFLIPCVQFVHVNLIGVLSGSDLFPLAAFLLMSRFRLTGVDIRFLSVDLFMVLYVFSRPLTLQHENLGDFTPALCRTPSLSAGSSEAGG